MNRTIVVLYGNISLKQDFDSSMKMKSEFSFWGNGGWRSNVYNLNVNRDVCERFYTILGKMRVETFMAKAGFAINRTNCDLPAGPYWFTFNRFEKCPKAKEGTKEFVFDFHLRKMNRTTVVLFGNVSLNRDLDDTTKIRNEFSLWGNGGWHSNAYNLDFDRNICKNFHSVLGKTFDVLMDKIGIVVNTTNCAIPANKYRMGNVIVSNWYFKALPVLIFGTYRVTVVLYSAQEELLGCLRVVIDILRQY
ncbi:hypothetical protein LSTR_LSTR003606 [Laodelphax striatellus]|uniref:MD-2-related lipid-recognition domain-containing protein n=1 Tax=Laodelphax striatellus TaxID=195883 RepID=A0A482WLT6_LAOST|nr:hypothetical protein LSTR_LSTR003606 [Laodelphax striatellus]